MDQEARPRVFISSIMPSEFAPYRDATARAIERASCEVVRAEQYPARAIAPRTACLDMVASCDAVVTILGHRYGNITVTGLSATEDEYREAVRLRKRVYLFLEKSGTPLEPRQQEFVSAVTAYVGDNWRKTFSTPEQLEALVLQALREDKDLGASNIAHGDGGAAERISRALSHKPDKRAGACWLQIAWTPLRDEEVIKPTLLVKPEFEQKVLEMGHTGMIPLFNYRAAKDVDATSARLLISQSLGDEGRGGSDSVVLALYADGTVSVALNVSGLKKLSMQDITGFGMYYIDPDDVRSRMEKAWSFARQFWHYIDEFRRYNALVYNVALHNVSHSRYAKAPQGRVSSFQFPTKDAPDPLLVVSAPRRISRSDLEASSDEIAESLEYLQLRFTELGH